MPGALGEAVTDQSGLMEPPVEDLSEQPLEQPPSEPVTDGRMSAAEPI